MSKIIMLIFSHCLKYIYHSSLSLVLPLSIVNAEHLLECAIVSVTIMAIMKIIR